MDKLSANFLNTPAHPPSSASAPGAEAGRSTDALRSAEAPATHRAMEALSLLRDAGRQQADWIKAMKQGSRQDRAGLQIPQRCGELPLPKNAERQCLNGIQAPRRPGTQPSISRLESVEGVREEIQRRRRDREETRGQDMQQRLRDEIVTLKAEIQRHELKAREHTQQIHELEAALEATGDKCAALTKKIGEMKQRYHQRILDLEAQLQEGLKGPVADAQRHSADAAHALRALLQAREEQLIEEQAAAQDMQKALRAKLARAQDELAKALAVARHDRCRCDVWDTSVGADMGCEVAPRGVCHEKTSGCAPAAAREGMDLSEAPTRVGASSGVGVTDTNASGREVGCCATSRGEAGGVSTSQVTRVLQETLRELSVLKSKSESEREARAALARDYISQARTRIHASSPALPSL